MSYWELTFDEVQLLQAIFLRDLSHGYAPIDVPQMSPHRTAVSTASLYAKGLITATLSPITPGKATDSGRDWMRVYGLSAPSSRRS